MLFVVRTETDATVVEANDPVEALSLVPEGVAVERHPNQRGEK